VYLVAEEELGAVGIELEPVNLGVVVDGGKHV
jgi:hypothetical protein